MKRIVMLVAISGLLTVACSGDAANTAPEAPAGLVVATGNGGVAFYRWKDGPAVMICHDIQGGGVSTAVSSSGPPWVRKEGGFVSSRDGRRFEWQLETTEGRNVNCRLDGKEYDLSKGTLFLAKTSGGKTEVQQFSRDLSTVQPNAESCKDFARKDPAVSKFLNTEAETPEAQTRHVSSLGGKFLARGQRSSWSPDGKKMVFGCSGNDNGIRIHDFATNRTTEFVSIGKDPAWAGKDGRRIAYVTGTGAAEAIWAAEVPYGKPLRVASGSMPSWSADGKTLFFQAFDQNLLMAADVQENGRFAPPRMQSAVTYRYPAVSPDGKQVAYKSGGELVIQQIDGGKPAKRFVLPQGFGMLGGWSPDSREFGFGGWNADDPMPCIILDVETGLARQVAARGLTMPAWSPDGTKITFDLRLRTGTEIWMIDAAVIQRLPTFKMVSAKFLANGQRSSWSPDGKKIVFARSLNQPGILIYDIATKKTTELTTAGKDPAWGGKDGRWIAYVTGSGTAQVIWAAEVPAGKPFRVASGGLPSWSADGKTMFFEALDRGQLMSCEVTENGQFSLPKVRVAVSYPFPAVSPDGKRVAYASGDDLVIQNLDDAKVAKRFALPKGNGILGGWSPDSREFGFGGRHFTDNPMPCIILDVETGLARQVAARGLTMPAWSPDGTKITFDLVLTTGTQIWMIDAEAVKELPTFKMAVPAGTAAERVETVVPPVKPELLHSIEWQDVEQGFPAHIYQTGVSADGKLFFGAGDAGPTGAIRIFEVASGKQIQELRPGKDVWFSFAAFVPGGKYLAAGYCKDKDLYLWDIATGRVVRKFVGHTRPDNHLAVSPDGKRMLSWGEDWTVRLWDVETGKELKKLEGHTEKAEGVFSPDGKKILTFSPDRTLRLWDADSGQELKKLEGHDDAVTGCFSPDGKQVLSSSLDRTVRLWDVETGKEIRRFEGPKDKVIWAYFVAAGSRVVARCDDWKFRVWETANGNLLREIDVSELGEDRWSMTASPDGRLGLVSHEDGSVRVYDLASGKEIHRYDGCPKARSFSFTPDGNFAVAGSFRAGLFVFRLPNENQVKQ